MDAIDKIIIISVCTCGFILNLIRILNDSSWSYLTFKDVSKSYLDLTLDKSNIIYIDKDVGFLNVSFIIFSLNLNIIIELIFTFYI